MAALSTGGLLAGLSLATFALRWVLVPHAFFHQNGQGPGWVDVAWRHVESAYGPGYAECYGWIASRSPVAPEGAVFLANACAGATIPALAYVLVRRATPSRYVAAGAAFALAVAPIGARLAQSESYFVAITWLLFVATLALVDAARLDVRSTALAADVAIALFAIAQVARIHPIAWVPAATTPVVMLTGARGLRAGARRAAASTAVVGLGVIVLAGPTMWAVLHGSLGQGWMPSVASAAGQTRAITLTWIAVTAWLLVRAWRSRAESARLAPVALLAVVVGVALKGNLVRGDTAAVNAAYAGLYAPVVVAIVASGAPRWLATLPCPPRLRGGAMGLAMAAGGAVFALASLRATCTLPTDALELSWVLGWRGSLPRNAVVSWYGHAGRRMLDPPFYRGAEMPTGLRLEDPTAPAVTRGAYYVHTSLCATDEGRATCERFEETHRLVPVRRRVLPAIGSLPWLPFTVGTVEVVLYRVGD